MNALELPMKIADLNGTLDLLKSVIMDKYNAMLGMVKDMIQNIQQMLMAFVAKGTQWVGQHANEIKMMIAPKIQQAQKCVQKAIDWMKKQIAVATKYIEDKISVVTGFVATQTKAVEGFVQDQLEKATQKQAELMAKAALQ